MNEKSTHFIAKNNKNKKAVVEKTVYKLANLTHTHIVTYSAKNFNTHTHNF